jgi:hypothetical protein
MAIANELSGEIAVALLSTKKKSPHELNDLKEMVFKIHSTLQQMADQTRRPGSRKSQTAYENPSRAETS